MVTIGHDAHLKTSTLTAVDSNGKKLMRKKIDNDPAKLLAFVRQFPGENNWPSKHATTGRYSTNC